MAKIGANGAVELARATCKDMKGNPYIYVLTSDGRVLVKWEHPHQEFSIYRNNVPEEFRTRRNLVSILTTLRMREIRLVMPPAEQPEIQPVVPPRAVRRTRPRDIHS
jgi:hypothetical protein